MTAEQDPGPVGGPAAWNAACLDPTLCRALTTPEIDELQEFRSVLPCESLARSRHSHSRQLPAAGLRARAAEAPIGPGRWLRRGRLPSRPGRRVHGRGTEGDLVGRGHHHSRTGRPEQSRRHDRRGTRLRHRHRRSGRPGVHVEHRAEPPPRCVRRGRPVLPAYCLFGTVDDIMAELHEVWERFGISSWSPFGRTSADLIPRDRQAGLSP